MADTNKLRVALIGIGDRGAEVEMEMAPTGLMEVVALCDADLGGRHTVYALQKYPSARRYSDWRRLFDEMAGQLDAVVVATPDHSHFPICMRAIAEGVHVYCEKPVGRTFLENQLLIEAAKAHPQVVTQMGNQGHTSGAAERWRVWTEAGIIKDVTRIDVFMNEVRRWHGYDVGIDRFPSGEAVPDTLDWDQWLSGVAWHDYSDKFHTMNWRCWYDFGTGALGDWGAHLFDHAHHYLHLGLPSEVKVHRADGWNNFFFPMASTLQFRFPRRGAMPSCDLWWYDGMDNRPELPEGFEWNPRKPGYLAPGSVIYSDSYVFQGGHHDQRLKIIPRSLKEQLDPVLPKTPKPQYNHYESFLRACRGELKTASPFEIACELCQVLCLGVIAQRLGHGFRFDITEKRIPGDPFADALLAGPPPRKGWEEYYSL